MKRVVNSLTFIVLAVFIACSNPPNKEKVNEPILQEISKADQIIEASIQAHGGELYNKAHYQFTFRGNLYRFNTNKAAFEYEFKGLNKNGDSIRTLLTQNKVQVWMNNAKLELNEKQKMSYSDNLNSVIYFATLPHKLGDNSVNKVYEGTTSIFNKTYEVIKVTFKQEGGGTDFDDEYYYWINAETMLIDYLAYKYHTNGGGVRFRVAYHPVKVEGIHFQDYVNYKVEVGTALVKLPFLYEKGMLQELSRIETENIIQIN
jgi:hypothetical protein